ncbi:MAG: M23 family metallopeptidase [Aphanocapsa sp. GSE-SYN-MK-11-07L]|nr:M23 family metallopeptidase [Aphanocapsa sp. GSE-SYN-MK-11-07L]
MGEVKRQIVAQSINQSSSKTSPNPLISSSQFLPQIARRGIFPQLPNLDLPPLSPAERYLPGSGGMTTGFIWPAKGVFTSGYGPRWGRMHRGIDIAAPIGTAIVAAAAGTVVTSEWNSGGFGNLVKIRHPDGSLTLYAHNNRLIARVGEYVQQGQLISEMGSTGRSTGPHVHFEIHPPGMGAVNPMHYLSRG